MTGNLGVSTDGCGSLAQTCTLTANVPAGATVVAAYLYTATFTLSSVPTNVAGLGGTFGGNAVSYTALGLSSPQANFFLQAGRSDVTATAAAAIDGGPGGTYNFTVTETDANQDGEGLVVVYSLGSLPVSTVGILDGFSATTGDSASINFSSPLDPTQSGFFADMFVGDSFSCCSQTSRITVNGTVITENAGNADDGSVANGALITVGGWDDPVSPFLPSYADDHERYSLIPQIPNGSTSILIQTLNPSNDDNIFLEVFHVLGEGTVSTGPQAPEPATLTLVGLGCLGAARKLRRRLAA
ncbi:MAG TPA: PEP-CTERM sorting domain-containing protein [Vicinamibacterales bacterium]|nr:PEP-CTERM sorting domain-containing protein [Vicinamibacterales bacterium]